jgi:hypothetical protein
VKEYALLYGRITLELRRRQSVPKELVKRPHHTTWPAIRASTPVASSEMLSGFDQLSIHPNDVVGFAIGLANEYCRFG